jgi:hypothetical protein
MLDGYRIFRDHFVGPQTTIPTYARSREYWSTTDGRKVFWQYDRRSPFLDAWKVTLIADDEKGLFHGDIAQILGFCRFSRFLLVEVAVDFDPVVGVNRRFIVKHARFGKSRRRGANNKRRALHCGCRKGAKLVRSYHKDELGVFRVEVELHGSLLRRNGISTLDDFIYLPDVICPKHLQFVDVDRQKLRRYLDETLGDAGNRVAAGASMRIASLRRTRHYLGRKGVANIHRFLVPLALNDEVRRALDRWARQFKEGRR